MSGRKRGYLRPVTLTMPVVTCPHCNKLVWPKYKVTEGGTAGYGTKLGFEVAKTAPRRRKSSTPYSPPSPGNDGDAPSEKELSSARTREEGEQ